jgi:hypothetical protein
MKTASSFPTVTSTLLLVVWLYATTIVEALSSRTVFTARRIERTNGDLRYYRQQPPTVEYIVSSSHRRMSHFVTRNDENLGLPTTNIEQRRSILLLLPVVLSAPFVPTLTNAFDMEYPMELRAPDNVNDIRNADNRRARKMTVIREQQQRRASRLTDAPIPIVWGGALWFLSGSRSNPLATPLANLIYDARQEKWLQDRNEGLFANLPWEYFIILGIVFLALGYGTDLLVTAIAEGEKTISLQLACVSLIGGCSLELGRISSGAKKQTREEEERSTQLDAEFYSFATNRLQPGGNCHRNEVVQAFRRYYSKYRQSDSVEYPLSDLEIEQLLRNYCRTKGVEVSPAGFYSGIQINSDADAFVKK